MALGAESHLAKPDCPDKWLELAARQGDARAVRARDQLAAERLAPAELEQAKHLADAWRPR